MKKAVLILIVAIVCIKFLNLNKKVSLGPGVKVVEAPIQDKISDPHKQEINGYSLSEVAIFSLKAKVLAKKNYSMDRESDLSPVDLALGWQNMSDESVLKKIKISQSNRFYYWRVKEFPIPRHEIETQSANMHLIPENSSVKRALKKVKVGDIVKLSGSLVNVEAQDGWHWKSSLTRTDTGNGACEVVLVQELQVVNP